MHFLVTGEDSGSRLDLFLSRKTLCSRRQIKSQIESHLVHINGIPAQKPATHLSVGDQITTSLSEELSPARIEPVEGALDIIYEDDDFIAVNKIQGLVVHPATSFHGVTLAHHLAHRFLALESLPGLSSTRPGIVHRLDRGTSGLILVAKNRHTQEALSAAFKQRQIDKEYRCIVWGKTPEQGIITTPIGRHPVQRHKMSSRSDKVRTAWTRWERLAIFDHLSYLRVLPETGRTHQIRVHLSEADHPIVGDRVYGRSVAAKGIQNLDTGLATEILAHNDTLLHAYRLRFIHPTRSGHVLDLVAPLPDYFERTLQTLRKVAR